MTSLVLLDKKYRYGKGTACHDDESFDEQFRDEVDLAFTRGEWLFTSAICAILKCLELNADFKTIPKTEKKVDSLTS